MEHPQELFIFAIHNYFPFILLCAGVVTYYWPQILSQATSGQLKGRLNPFELEIWKNCLFILMHWTQNQIIGRTVKEEELVLCWATEHTHSMPTDRQNMSSQMTMYKWDLYAYLNDYLRPSMRTNIPFQGTCALLEVQQCHVSPGHCPLPPISGVGVVLLHVAVWGWQRTVELAAKWKARTAQAKIMYDPKAPQTWTQMGVIWIEEDWQLFESKH